MRIAVVDYQLVPTNPIGGCHRTMVAGLCDEHDITVFAVRFDNPRPDRIRWVRVPVPTRPLALLFVAFHLVAPLCVAWQRLRHRQRYDLVQMVESNLSFGDVSYAQFCHRGFLRRGGTGVRARGLRPALRWLDHRLHALVEPWVYRRVRTVVVPSQGLQRELAAEHPATRGKTVVIGNPVDVARMRRPASFPRDAVRAELGLGPDDVAVVFVALGHFERKGLPLLLDALASLGDPRTKLLVVGGQPDLVRAYQQQVRRRSLGDVVTFLGMRDDVREPLWASDVFALPSAYEAFPLVALEAAAAGLPLLVTPLHGVEDLVVEGRNGMTVARTVPALTEGLRAFSALSRAEREEMGRRAQEDVQRYSPQAFLEGWRRLYEGLRRDRADAPAPGRSDG